MTEKLQLRDAVYRLEDTIREIRNRFADDQGRVDEIAFEESEADPLLALAVPLVEQIAERAPLPGVVQLATEIINRCVADQVLRGSYEFVVCHVLPHLTFPLNDTILNRKSGKPPLYGTLKGLAGRLLAGRSARP
jgi:hypothetical protein